MVFRKASTDCSGVSDIDCMAGLSSFALLHRLVNQSCNKLESHRLVDSI